MRQPSDIKIHPQTDLQINPQISQPINQQRETIRRQMRQARQALAPHQQDEAAQQLTQNFQALADVKHANTIALYLSFQGEINTQALINSLWLQNKQVLVPVLHPFSKGHLLFLRYLPNSSMVKNQYGIAEPKLDQTQIVPLANIDIIATPLVAFDNQCNRLGMGGGYYDRTLEMTESLQKKPLIIGLAHDLQQVEKLPLQPWDKPLDKIITPQQVWG